jgi:hypothetical protein
MSITYAIPNEPGNNDTVVRTEVKIWCSTGHLVTQRSVRTIAEYFAETGDAMDTLARCKPVELDAVIFRCLTIMRGPMVGVDEQMRLMALLAWTANRYAREAQLFELRRRAAMKPH